MVILKVTGGSGEQGREAKRAARCKGRVSYGPDGEEFECGYLTSLSCEECKYCPKGSGRKDPEAKCNQLD